jgi:hypothetical protein
MKFKSFSLTKKEFLITCLVCCAFQCISALFFLYQLELGDLFVWEAFRGYNPLHFSIAAVICFLNGILLFRRSNSIKFAAFIEGIGAIMAWGFYIWVLGLIGGWIVLLIFNPLFLLFVALPVAALIYFSIFLLYILVAS